MATTTIFSCLLVGCLYWCIATAAPLSLVAPLTPEYSPPWARRHTADNNVAYERYVRRRPPKYYGDQEIFEVREIYYKPRPKLTMTTTPSARYIDDDLMDLIILCDFQPAPKECENLTQRRKQSTKMPTILKPTPARTTTSTSTSTTTSTTTTTTTTRRPTRPSYQSIPTLPPIPSTEIQTTTTTTTPPTTTTTAETTTLTDYPLIPILNEIQDEEVEIEETTLSQPEDNVKTSIINEDQEEEDRHIINILPTETETVDNNDDTEEEEIIDYNDSAGINDNEIERTTIANDDENNDDYNEEDNFELDNSIDEDPEDNGMGQLDHSLSERK